MKWYIRHKVNTPGGLTVTGPFQMLPDDAAAEASFETQRWPEGRFSPDCRSTRTAVISSGKPMPYRCKDFYATLQRPQGPHPTRNSAAR